MLLNLAALALAVAPAQGDEGANADILRDCAALSETPAAAPTGWTLIDASGIATPAELAEALRALPRGQRAAIHGGRFERADLRALTTMLAGVCLADTNLDGTNWEGSEIPSLRLVRVSLAGANARGVRWPGLSTYGANLAGSDFSGAHLPYFRFVSAWQGADFGDTTFRGANLAGASFACGITIDVWCINGAPDLAGADLTRADISGFWLWDRRNVAGALLDRTVIAPASFAQLGYARIAGPLRMAKNFTSPYPQEDGEDRFVVPVAEIAVEEARALIAAVSAEAEEDRASFDCALAASPVEKLICAEYESALRAQDRELADVWAKVRAAGKGDLAGQRRWLASRDACGDDSSCLSELYTQRIAVLRGHLGTGIVLRPGESVIYHEDSLQLPEAMRSGELYRRILPVLIDASDQEITLTGNPDGSIAAEGSAVGANAHTCDLGALVTRFDPATGWWSARTDGGAPVPLFRVEGRRIVLRYSGNFGNTPEEAGDFMTCGMRASFVDGVDLSPR
ncbi:MAG: pentapeptide repeat-containing protein [Sphingomonadaceae bacterium]|nr:pentapeptide repeat-containing protein [Sphingomonadaceae bacterium]